jgi:hypothetical protein
MSAYDTLEDRVRQKETNSSGMFRRGRAIMKGRGRQKEEEKGLGYWFVFSEYVSDLPLRQAL